MVKWPFCHCPLTLHVACISSSSQSFLLSYCWLSHWCFSVYISLVCPCYCWYNCFLNCRLRIHVSWQYYLNHWDGRFGSCIVDPMYLCLHFQGWGVLMTKPAEQGMAQRCTPRPPLVIVPGGLLANVTACWFYMCSWKLHVLKIVWHCDVPSRSNGLINWKTPCQAVFAGTFIVSGCHQNKMIFITIVLKSLSYHFQLFSPSLQKIDTSVLLCGAIILNDPSYWSLAVGLSKFNTQPTYCLIPVLLVGDSVRFNDSAEIPVQISVWFIC